MFRAWCLRASSKSLLRHERETHDSDIFDVCVHRSGFNSLRIIALPQL